MEKTIGFECRCVSNLIKREMNNSDLIRESRNLTGMHGFLIGYIYHYPGDVFQRDIEAEFEIRRSTVTQILQLMEKNGLIERQSVQSDARLKKIVLTEYAVRMQRKIEEQIRETERKMTEGIAPEDLETFFRVMDQVKQNLLCEDK